ncbi:protein-disulfide reductase DsbD domain-containing protein [Edaphocola aurantiacus]|uniref:protein-disulfide reductase DsbD domain-containing protein n=1 Tax=Edaphocola aurantiacus TaxID=2601682 RepID=UPI001C956BDF|nr:protein-disulfide reductase DsbD domain-containing protein [Edaphocola aurantiacus]
MKHILLFILGIFLTSASFAQQTEKIVSWTVTVKATNADQAEYELSAKATMQKGYHIWAMDAGGDGSLIATSITITPDLNWKDKWMANQRPHDENLDFIEGTVFSYNNTVTLSRKFTADKGTKKIKGIITYQSCNESMCLPPDDVPFEVTLP